MATFTLKPDYVYEEVVSVSVLVSRFESGASQRRIKKARTPRTFILRFVNRPKIDYIYVRDFFIARTGPFEEFNWVNLLDGIMYPVHFMDSKFMLTWSRFNSYNFEFSVQEAK